jgi:oligopeptide transport system permease protein
MHAVPGGPFQSEKAISPELQAELEAKYGLDKPLITQYATYLKDIVLHFDFGPSIKQKGRSVTDIISQGLFTSAKIGLTAASVAIAVGITLGSYAALKRNRRIDRIIMVLSTAFVSMPSFIIGTLFLYVFSLALGLFPATGSPDVGVSGLVLPTVTLSLYPMAYITRLMRSSMLETLGQDYIRTAKAKGLSQRAVIIHHALKNSLIPIITYAGPMVAYIVTGSLVVEKIFAVPGIGRDFVNSITNRDYPLIMGTTIILSSLVVIMNLISDILYKAVDPRIKLD